MSETRVLIVDDHTLFRHGLATLLQRQKNMKVVGEAGNGLEALERAKELRPDVILMDISMPRCDGVKATRLLKDEVPTAKVIMLTVSEKDQDLFAAIRAGAKGYILKSAEPKELIRSIGFAAEGESMISPAVATKLFTEFAEIGEDKRQKPKSGGSELTQREREILKLLSRGATNKEIAATLCLAENTVKTHLHHILEKMHLHNRSEAAAYAAKEGLT